MISKKNMGFLEHLEELRWHIIRSLIFIAIGTIIAFFFKSFIFNKVVFYPRMPEFPTNKFLKNMADYLDFPRLAINQEPLELINIKMAGQFQMHLTVSLILGIVLAFPLIFNEFWKFIKPGLYNKEKKNAKGAIFYINILFITGVAFGYYIISPLSINFLGTYHTSTQVANQIYLGSYISLLTSVVLASGIVFELPVFIYFSSKIGLLTPTFLKKYRRHAIIVILLLAAIITPPDIFSLILVTIPLVLLYELGIYISGKVVHSKKSCIKLLNSIKMKLHIIFFNLSLAIFSASLNAQQIKVKGRVLDANTKLPIYNASVYMIKTSKYVLTDRKGTFSFETTSLGDSISISAKNYIQQVQAMKKTNIIYLEHDVYSLEEVIIRKRKKKV